MEALISKASDKSLAESDCDLVVIGGEPNSLPIEAAVAKAGRVQHVGCQTHRRGYIPQVQFPQQLEVQFLC